MVGHNPDTDLALVIAQIQQVEQRRSQRAVYVRIEVPVGVDRERLAARLAARLAEQGSAPEIDTIPTSAHRVKLNTLDFELEGSE